MQEVTIWKGREEKDRGHAGCVLRHMQVLWCTDGIPRREGVFFMLGKD